MKRTLSIIGWVSILVLIGIVGGMDTGRITVGMGIIGSAVMLGMSAYSLHRGGWMS